jgi:hypothetical protein
MKTTSAAEANVADQDVPKSLNETARTSDSSALQSMIADCRRNGV